jgi:hypothetical protein
VENSLNRKMESIYKTLTSVFENINDLQAKLNDRAKEQRTGREHIDKAIELTLQRQPKEKPVVTATGEK